MLSNDEKLLDESRQGEVLTLEKTIDSKRVTYDFERQMEGATLLKCSEFGTELIKNM